MAVSLCQHAVIDFQADLWQMTYYTPSYLSSTFQAQESLYGLAGFISYIAMLRLCSGNSLLPL